MSKKINSRPFVVSAAIALMLVLAACASTGGSSGPSDARGDTLSDYQKRLPAKPALAAYEFQLQQRIDNAFATQYWNFHNANTSRGSQNTFGFDVLVRADGRMAPDENDVRRSKREEPVLTGLAVQALMKVNADPVPFPADLTKEVGSTFRYHAQFTEE